MKNKVLRTKEYIDIYIANVKWLRHLILPALLALVGYNFFEIKSYQLLGEITKKVEDGSTTAKACLMFVICFILAYTLALLYEIFYAYFAKTSIRSALTNFFAEYLRISYQSFHSFGIGEAQFVINRRVYALIDFLSAVCIDFISNLLFFLIAFGSLGHEIKNSKLKIIVLAIICLFLLFSSCIQYLRSCARFKLNIGYENSSRKMYDILYNYERIVAYDNVEIELEKYKSSMDSQIFWGTIFWVSYELVAFFNAIFFLFVNQYMMGVLGTSTTESLDLRSFILVFNKAKEEVIEMVNNIDIISTSFVNLDQSKTQDCPMDENKNGNDIPIKRTDIIAENISFAYKDKLILKDLSIKIMAGEKIAITGVNGSGKSTFTKLLLGLYDYHGSLKIDGIEYNQLLKTRIRNAIAYVPQNAFLFDNSILENLKFADRNMNDQKVIDLCKAYNTHELFKTLGYNKRVGERGKYLSGGQRQKICFMRAALKNCKTVVLDEATSNMDEQSEYQIIQAMNENMKNKTIIMIIHNLSLLKCFDRIIFFDDNNKIEDGSFDQLMENSSGRFPSFYHNSIVK